MVGEWKPDSKLQEEIFEFWSIRGYDEIEGALGKYQIKFISKHKPTGMIVGQVDLVYLEQFYEWIRGRFR